MEPAQLQLTNTYSGSDLILAYLATGLWLFATGGAWILGFRAIVASLADRRRLVSALRWGTLAASTDLVGLIVMIAVANPVRWQTAGWLISLIPLGLTMLAVLLATRPEPVSLSSETEATGW